MLPHNFHNRTLSTTLSTFIRAIDPLTTQSIAIIAKGYEALLCLIVFKGSSTSQRYQRY